MVVCPRANRMLKVGEAPLERYAEAGVALALGTASPAACGAPDLLAEAAAWCDVARSRGLAYWPSAAGPVSLEEQAVRLSTVAGAQALGWGATAGTLEVGRPADLVGVAFQGSGSSVWHDVVTRGDVVLTVLGGVIKARRDGPVTAVARSRGAPRVVSARGPLPDARPTADKDAVLVQRMFDRVAGRYDLANALLSFGSDQHWRRCATAAVGPVGGSLVLDVATGTGRLATALCDAGARVVGVDFSMPMLEAGAQRADRAGVAFVNGDGTRLPFADATFDAVTIAFGLRNLPDTVGGLRELLRVTKPGGRLVVLEFSKPTWAPFRLLYERYLVALLPRVAELVSSDGPAYRYSSDSIRAWPDQQALARLVAAAGWEQPAWSNLTRRHRRAPPRDGTRRHRTAHGLARRAAARGRGRVGASRRGRPVADDRGEPTGRPRRLLRGVGGTRDLASADS